MSVGELFLAGWYVATIVAAVVSIPLNIRTLRRIREAERTLDRLYPKR